MASDTITEILSHLPSPAERDFFALLEAMHRAKFTGQTTLHWKNGVPRQIDLGAPVKLSIVSPLDKAEPDPPSS